MATFTPTVGMFVKNKATDSLFKCVSVSKREAVFLCVASQSNNMILEMHQVCELKNLHHLEPVDNFTIINGWVNVYRNPTNRMHVGIWPTKEAALERVEQLKKHGSELDYLTTVYISGHSEYSPAS